MTNKKRRRALDLTALGTAAVLGGAYYSYQFAFSVDRKRVKPAVSPPHEVRGESEKLVYEKNIKSLLEQPYEMLTIRSYDGLKLSGKYYAGNPRAPVVLLFHGYRGLAERDGCATFRFWREKGFSVFLADQRGHGASEGTHISLGIRERWDCFSWIQELRHLLGPDTEMLLMGVSMGAATVLMAGGLPLPKQVQGVIADCAFAAPEDILDETMRRRRYPLFLTWPLLRLGAKLYGNLDIRACTALESVKRISVPVLLIHGEDDHVVPCEMAYALRDTCASPVTLLTVPGAGHSASYYVDTASYLSSLEQFLQQIWGVPAS